MISDQKTNRQKVTWIVQWGENNLSDLANSCEYLTSEKLCLAVSESEKAKASRQIRCKNDEKMACCYLCMSVMDCAAPCRFLGNDKIDSSPIKVKKTEVERTLIDDSKIQEDQTKNTPVTYCSLCDAELSQTRTKFRIDGWKGSDQKLVDDDLAIHGEEILPVIVYLFPKCGKIDLRADEK
jgi:hypothetical protein